MNDYELDALQIVLNNEAVMSALKKVFHTTTEDIRPRIGLFESNRILGEKYRAFDMSREVIDRCFTKLESYKRASEEGRVINRAI